MMIIYFEYVKVQGYMEYFVEVGIAIANVDNMVHRDTKNACGVSDSIVNNTDNGVYSFRSGETDNSRKSKGSAGNQLGYSGVSMVDGPFNANKYLEADQDNGPHIYA